VTPVQLYDAGVGDVIEIEAHWPIRVTVTGQEYAGIPSDSRLVYCGIQGDQSRLSWTAETARGPWHGTTLLSDAIPVVMVVQAGPDNPLRRQYEQELEAALIAAEQDNDDVEAACKALLATLREG
jgi:hypothetical protein